MSVRGGSFQAKTTERFGDNTLGWWPQRSVAGFCVLHRAVGPRGVGIGATGFFAGTAGFLKGLLPYRPAFIGLTILLLGISFYLAYGKPRSAGCAPGEACAAGTRNGVSRAWFWVMATFAMVLILAPYWLGL